MGAVSALVGILLGAPPRGGGVPNILSATSETRTIGLAAQHYVQHLACLRAKRTLMIRSKTEFRFIKHKKEDAHVLDGSLEFLELIQVLASVAHKYGGSQSPSPIVRAVFLQFTSMSM